LSTVPARRASRPPSPRTARRGGAAATTTTAAAGEGAAVVLPFEGAAVRVDHRNYESTSEHDAAEGRRATPGAAGAPPELTAENVLDEVRPYLISDGGNVSVRSVGDGEGGGGRGDNGAAGRAEERVPRPRGGVRILRQLDGDDEDGNREGAEGEVWRRARGGGAGRQRHTGGGGEASSLTVEAARAEVDRMLQAMTAMGEIGADIGGGYGIQCGDNGLPGAEPGQEGAEAGAARR